MALTRDFKQSVVDRAARDPAFTHDATIGFEQLAAATDKPSKCLHRMLSPQGNPSVDNLAAIFRAMRAWMNVNLEAHCVAA